MSREPIAQYVCMNVTGVNVCMYGRHKHGVTRMISDTGIMF